MTEPISRTKAKYPKIIKAMAEGRTQDEIAQELGYTNPRSISRIVNTDDFQIELAEWMRGQLDKATKWIDTLWDTGNQTNMREAARLQVSIAKHVFPRLNFTKIQRESIIRHEGQQATDYDIALWNKTIELLSPNCKQAFAEAHRQAKHELNQ